MQHKTLRRFRLVESGSHCSSDPRLSNGNMQYEVGTPVTAHPSVQIFPLQPHLHIELEVIFLSIRAYGIVDLKLLIVFFV